ncbi:MAG: elongation factor P maturation arginine rhamnosyltransferase EarP, partial [Fibrobacter sp.]|nr:elongation factor P maturation arginine rhamnosyltransferase EarP [Fibrobacter sp.]
MLSSVLKACDCNIDSNSKNVIFGTVFSYERGFDNLLESLTKVDYQVCLIVLGDKSHKSMRDTLRRFGESMSQKTYMNYKNIHICFSQLLPQELYDSLLYCTDFNLVRGEDSLVRAICSGKPFVWNAYIQENRYQTVKVDAFLECFGQYFDDSGVFERYKRLMFSYNNAPDEKTMQVTDENFYYFISDLNKIEHAT